MVIYEDQAVTGICTYIYISKMCGLQVLFGSRNKLCPCCALSCDYLSCHIMKYLLVICTHAHTKYVCMCIHTCARMRTHTHTHTHYLCTCTQVTVTHSGLLCRLVLFFVSFSFFFWYTASYWIIMWVSVMISVSLTSWLFVSTTFQLGSSRLLSKQDLSNCVMRAFIVLSELDAFILILVTTA